jgi:hypothetical protein
MDMQILLELEQLEKKMMIEFCVYLEENKFILKTI